MIIIILFIIDEKWEQTKFLSTDEWINVGISITLLRNLKKKQHLHGKIWIYLQTALWANKAGPNTLLNFNYIKLQNKHNF